MTREQRIEAVVDTIDSSPDFTIHDQAEMIVDKLFPEPEPGTTDDKLRPGQTVKEAIDRCIEIIEVRRAETERGSNAGREFSIAITDLESAQMRYARGRHMEEGSFSPSDVDRWLADGKDVKDTVAERDQAAGKTT